MATTLPRRSPRLATLALTVESQPEPEPQPRQKDTRVRCGASVSNRRCNRISCDGVTAFCTIHKPDPPSDSDILSAYEALQTYVNANPLRPKEWYTIESIVQRDEIDAKIIEYQTYQNELETVLKPYKSLYELCENLHIDHPFVSHYTKIEQSLRSCWSSWDLLMDKQIEFHHYGWLASNRGGKGWRGHHALCYVCNTEVLYESDTQPSIHYCPTHLAEKKKEAREQMTEIMALPHSRERNLAIIQCILEYFEAIPRKFIQEFVSKNSHTSNSTIRNHVEELQRQLLETE